MGKHKYEIYTTGYANEIVVGNVSKEDAEKIKTIADENDMEMPELYNDWDILEENELTEWFENDGKEHIYGSSFDSSLIIVKDLNSDETIIKKEFSELELPEDDDIEYWKEVVNDYKDEPIFHAATVEKGVPMEVTLELDEPFDESKLTYRVLEVFVGDNHYYEIVNKLYYDGEELDTDINSTDTKDFIVDIITE